MTVSKYRRANWSRHFKRCTYVAKESFVNKMGTLLTSPPSTEELSPPRLTPVNEPVGQVVDVSIVCDGLWARVIGGVDVTNLHGASVKYGRPKHVFYRKDENGKVQKHQGTFHHPECLRVSVIPGTTRPNGTSTCNICARIEHDPEFIKHVLNFDPDYITPPQVNHRYMSECDK